MIFKRPACLFNVFLVQIETMPTSNLSKQMSKVLFRLAGLAYPIVYANCVDEMLVMKGPRLFWQFRCRRDPPLLFGNMIYINININI